MGFALKAFAAGAATALSEKLDKDEKAAEESAKVTVNRLSSKLAEREKETAEKLKGYSNTIGALKSYHSGWTEQQLYNIARNPLVAEQTLSAFKEGRLDPATFNPQKFADLADVVPNQKEAMARITEEEKAQQLGKVPSVPESSFFDMKDRATRIQQDRIAQYAKGFGVTPEQLYGADKAAPVIQGDQGVKYDMSQVTKARPIEQQGAQIVADLMKAKESGDEAAVAKATEAAAQFSASQRLMSASLSGDQALIDKIMAKPENANLSPEQQLRKRQSLEVRPGEGIQRLTATDISRAARGAFNDALASSLGEGKISMVTNQLTGERTPVPKEIVKPEELAAAKTAARQGIINLYTDPRTGLPVSNLHKNALIEIGAQFNPDGSVVKIDTDKAKPSNTAPAEGTVKLDFSGIDATKLSSEQQQAISWAKSNPTDPRSKDIVDKVRSTATVVKPTVEKEDTARYDRKEVVVSRSGRGPRQTKWEYTYNPRGLTKAQYAEMDRQKEEDK